MRARKELPFADRLRFFRHKKAAMEDLPAIWVRAVAGDCLLYDRFRMCWEARQPHLGSLGVFAQQIGIHPSSLTRSNFRLAAARRTQVAGLLDVPPGFLGSAPDRSTDLPDFLLPVRALIDAILAVCATAGVGKDPLGLWALDAVVLRLEAEAVASRLPAHPSSTVMTVHGQLAAIARRRLAATVQVALPLHDWCHIIELLVARAMDERPDDLQQPPLRLARRLHRSLQGSV